MLTALAVASAVTVIGANILSSYSSRRPPTEHLSKEPRLASPAPFKERAPVPHFSRTSAAPPSTPMQAQSVLKDWTGHRFHYGSALPVFESQLYEFKAAQGSHRSLTGFFARYACAFLNARGGQLLLGINDDGQVLGVQCDRKRYDDLCLSFDGIAEKRISPQVDPSLYSVDVYSVLPGAEKTADDLKLQPLVVIVITFLPSLNLRNVYHEIQKVPCTRASASVRKMSPELVRDRRMFGKVVTAAPSSRPASNGPKSRRISRKAPSQASTGAPNQAARSSSSADCSTQRGLASTNRHPSQGIPRANHHQQQQHRQHRHRAPHRAALPGDHCNTGTNTRHVARPRHASSSSPSNHVSKSIAAYSAATPLVFPATPQEYMAHRSAYN